MPSTARDVEIEQRVYEAMKLMDDIEDDIKDKKEDLDECRYTKLFKDIYKNDNEKVILKGVLWKNMSEITTILMTLLAIKISKGQLNDIYNELHTNPPSPLLFTSKTGSKDVIRTTHIPRACYFDDAYDYPCVAYSLYTVDHAIYHFNDFKFIIQHDRLGFNYFIYIIFPNNHIARRIHIINSLIFPSAKFKIMYHKYPNSLKHPLLVA